MGLATHEALLEKAKAQLVIQQPFFAGIVLRRPLVWDDSIPTACINPQGRIRLNPEFIASLSVAQVKFLLCHEALHYVLLHAARLGGKHAGAWNIACDAVINDTLRDAGIGEFIEGGVNVPNARHDKAEDHYRVPPPGEGQHLGDDGGGNGPGGIGNDLEPGDGPPMTEAERSELEANVKIELVQAAKAAKIAGKLPANIARMVGDLLEGVPIPWHKKLERFMTSLAGSEQSWSRPNRRFVHAGMYMPGQKPTLALGTVVVAVDTSGSIGARELAEFSYQLNCIMEQARPEKVQVVYCDSEINHVDEFSGDDLPLVLNPHGGGGTDFRPVFEFADTLPEAPDCIIYLTDLYGPMPDSSLYPTMWVTTESEQANFGEVIKIEVPHE